MKAIIFYCKDCFGWLFICRGTEEIIKDSKEAIIQLIAEGNKMVEIDLDTTTEINTPPCKCKGG